jgi:hypothetical protein
MDKEPQPLTANELESFYEYLRKNIKEYCKNDTPFKKKARFWQREWSKKHHLTLEPGKKVLLSKEDTENGKIFYRDDFGILKKWVEGKRLKTKDKKYIHNDMLCSEHIPFNMFVPLYESESKAYLKEVLNHILDKEIKNEDIKKIKKIHEIEDLDSDFKMIEHAPGPPSEYLNDKTSFDVYIEYRNNRKEKCIIGIEIKYTETSYSLEKGSAESQKVDKQDPNHDPIYYNVTDYSKAYKGEYIDILKDNKYRQIWRNHILGVSILKKDDEDENKNDKFKHFTSITIYPEGNEHFGKVSEEYVNFLEKGHEYNCLFFSYEKLFDYIENELCKNDERYQKWIKWMRKRYIVNDDEIRKICQL